MQQINSYINEKLRIGKSIKVDDYSEIYGKGEEKRFASCTIPCQDLLEPQVNDLIRNYCFKSGFDMNTQVYFMSGESILDRHKDLTDKFKNAIRNCKPTNIKRISDFEPDIQICIYTLEDYPRTDVNTIVLQITQWKKEPYLTYWYIKI